MGQEDKPLFNNIKQNLASRPSLPGWKNILWREWKHCEDTDYARRLYQAVATGPTRWIYRFTVVYQSRPHAAEVEAALYEVCRMQWGGKYIWAKYLRRLERTKRQTLPLNKVLHHLEAWHWLERFVARHVLLHRGGEAMGSLALLANQDSSVLQRTALWLIVSICAETKTRLAQNQEKWVCSLCLQRCSVHPLKHAWLPNLKFYGCRACQRSHNLLSCPQGIVATLNDKPSPTYHLVDGLLYANWLLFRHPFDFDRVEIIAAADESIERFAVQVGNDTDPNRAPRYQDMSCQVKATCSMSLNTKRILENAFAKVEVNHE